MSYSKISIVTVAAFDHQRLEKTLVSLLTIESLIEYIVVVPTLDLPSQEMVKRYAKSFKFQTRLLLDQQVGIYPAMNLALHNSTGDFVIFWNAGDTLNDPVQLGRFVNTKYPDGTTWIIFGAKFEWMDGPMLDASSHHKFVQQDKNSYISHQQIAVSRSLFLSMGGFDTRYRIAADFKAITMLSESAPYLLTEIALVNVEFPHLSSIRNRRGRIETFQILLRMHPIQILGIYRIISRELMNLIRKY